MKPWQKLVVVVWALVALSWVFIETEHCREAWLRYGMALDTCPAGELRQTAELRAERLRRGAEGRVSLAVVAHYSPGGADAVESTPVPEVRPLALELVDGEGRATPLPATWRASGPLSVTPVRLPDVPDGDYQLRARFETAIGAGVVTAALSLYSPARVHVLTDRPLYEPGHTVRFRAVVLRARDLAPLDDRPGSWVVTDPSGEVVLEERAPAGAWGVVAGSLPLDRGAATGAWSVAWRSADATDAAEFTVQAFTLPRFRVEAAPDRAYYRPGDTPVVRGAVIYASGAPVAGAEVDVRWSVEGAWPPPREWQERALPRRATTGASGRFELALPQIPADLQGTAALVAQVAAVDPAGDRAAGSARVTLSEDGILASAVTELGEGVVPGYNNRVYVRVTTPDGREVAGAKIRVSRAWEPSDPGIDAVLDEDGVAALQLDPGPPVNVVIPATPYRPPPRPPVVALSGARELLSDGEASIADQVAMERWLPALAGCARWVGDEAVVAQLALRADPGGAIAAAVTGESELERCAAGVVRGQRLPAGRERIYALAIAYRDPGLPALEVELESARAEPEGLAAALGELARRARPCLPRTAAGRLPRVLAWRARAGSRDVELGPWLAEPAGGEAGADALSCAVRSLAGGRARLPDPADGDALGVARFEVSAPAEEAGARPQPTTMLGYELLVAAELPGQPTARLRLPQGAIPALRLRVSPVLARPGDAVTAELIRGPGFRGEVPKHLVVRHLRGEQRVAVSPELRAAATIPADASGWVELVGGSARALVYVRPAAELTVTVAPGQPRYPPGAQAALAIRTQLGGRGGPAAVGLFGVDESLAQLAPLPGATDLGRVAPKVGTAAPAFGSLDGQALVLGRIRGKNAAAATVLRVSDVPRPPELDAEVTATGRTAFDPIAELTDRFYIALAELHTQVRQWEATAPPAEQLRPARLAALWNRALAACELRGERVTDAYGRRLRLSRLPPDLLALTDPRAVAVVGTRLPEDLESWAAWVAKEQP
jgi:hypothetical protein